jgi:hypothetical protein
MSVLTHREVMGVGSTVLFGCGHYSIDRVLVRDLMSRGGWCSDQVRQQEGSLVYLAGTATGGEGWTCK